MATGYDGGDGEKEIVAALKQAFAAEESDTIAAIKTKYYPIGHMIEIAIAKGYTKRLGFKGWMAIEIERGETHGRDCLSCWKCRTSFDAALAWWRTGNTGFMPAKLSGPRFAVEICKAYGNRMQGNTPTQKRKGKTAKELREDAARWRSRFDRLEGEHVKWAQEDNREPRVLYVIEREIAADEPPESEFPVEAIRPDQDDTSGVVADPEQETDDDALDEEDNTSGVVADTGHTAGDEANDNTPGVVAWSERGADDDEVTEPNDDTSGVVAEAIEPIIAKPTMAQIWPSLSDRLRRTIETDARLPGFRGRSGPFDQVGYANRTAFFSTLNGFDGELAAFFRQQPKRYWRAQSDRTADEIRADAPTNPPQPPIDPPPDPPPEPDPDVPPPEPPIGPDTPPEPDPDVPPADAPPDLSVGPAIRAVYNLVRYGEWLTCDMVADTLEQFPLATWHTDDLTCLGEALNNCSDWEHELTNAYFENDPTMKLFATADEVLVYEAEHGLQIHSWASIGQQLAPALTEQRRRAEQLKREKRGRAILAKRLPKVKKLKAMKALIDEIVTCQPNITEEGQRAIAFIRAMMHDDPQFSDCTIFEEYFQKAVEITERKPEEPNGTEPTNVVEFKPR